MSRQDIITAIAGIAGKKYMTKEKTLIKEGGYKMNGEMEEADYDAQCQAETEAEGEAKAQMSAEAENEAMIHNGYN